MESGPPGAKGAIALQQLGESWEHLKLKELVVEASRALALLDADRLEELALSCQALNRDLEYRSLEPEGRTAMRAALAVQAREAAGEMAVFGRVLEVTRANLDVMNRLRELRSGQLEYGGPQARGWSRTESEHGNN
jgi:plasmid stability protein